MIIIGFIRCLRMTILWETLFFAALLSLATLCQEKLYLQTRSTCQQLKLHHLHKYLNVRALLCRDATVCKYLCHPGSYVCIYIYIVYICVCVCVSGPVTHFLERNVFPVLLPGLEALLKEAQKHSCFKVWISSHNYLINKRQVANVIKLSGDWFKNWNQRCGWLVY